jgi:hypothetical protein
MSIEPIVTGPDCARLACSRSDCADWIVRGWIVQGPVIPIPHTDPG